MEESGQTTENFYMKWKDFKMKIGKVVYTFATVIWILIIDYLLHDYIQGLLPSLYGWIITAITSGVAGILGLLIYGLFSKMYVQHKT